MSSQDTEMKAAPTTSTSSSTSTSTSTSTSSNGDVKIQHECDYSTHVNLPHHDTTHWSTVTNHITSILQSYDTSPINTPTSYYELLHHIMHSSYTPFVPVAFVHFLTKEATPEESSRFYSTTLPFTLRLIQSLPSLFPSSFCFPHLLAYTTGTIHLTAHQCAALIAASFWCMMPPTPKGVPHPHINFDIVLSAKSRANYGKYRCILHYFERLRIDGISDRNISIIRRVMDEEQCDLCDPSSLSSNTTPLCPFTFHSTGTIEDNSTALQIDFANEYIGGGVLETGCVQEEIRFVINPECLVTMACCEVMRANEAIIIIGPERYSSYTGYGTSFSWGGDYRDDTKLDEEKRMKTVIVAIDALMCSFSGSPQFTTDAMIRESLKAYAGFSITSEEMGGLIYHEIATGNWGCGAFGGDICLKAMLQWIAATLSNRKLVYYTFGDRRADGLPSIIDLALESHLTVSQLWSMLVNYCKYADPYRGGKNMYKWLTQDMETLRRRSSCSHLRRTSHKRCRII